MLVNEFFFIFSKNKNIFCFLSLFSSSCTCWYSAAKYAQNNYPGGDVL